MSKTRPNASANVRLDGGTAAPLVTGDVREGLQSDYHAAVTTLAEGPPIYDATGTRTLTLTEALAATGYETPQLLDQLRNATPPPPGNEEQRDTDGRTPSGKGYGEQKSMGLLALTWDWIKLNPLKAVAGVAAIAAVVWYLRGR